MSRTVTATEVKLRMGTVLDWVVENDDEVIIASHNRPKAVIMSFDEYTKVQELRQQAQRQQALKRLDTLAQRLSARNQDIGGDEVDALAERFSDEVVREMIDEGGISYAGEPDHAGAA